MNVVFLFFLVIQKKFLPYFPVLFSRKGLPSSLLSSFLLEKNRDLDIEHGESHHLWKVFAKYAQVLWSLSVTC